MIIETDFLSVKSALGPLRAEGGRIRIFLIVSIELGIRALINTDDVSNGRDER